MSGMTEIISRGICSEASCRTFHERIQAILLPWERWKTGSEYGPPTEGDRISQAKNICFPKLDLTPNLHEFRLLLLLPSLGWDNEPVRGCLIISNLYLHSCYIAVRHSRGHPAVRGEIILDGRPTDITRNLELFLRHVRHPVQCRLLYVRDLCIQRKHEEENRKLLTGIFHAQVEDSSCGILEMNRVMEMLDTHQCLPELERRTEKLWHEAPTGEGEAVFHKPLILKQYWDAPYGYGDHPPEDEIASLPSYEYIPLDIAAHEIRLLGVHKAQKLEDTLFVEIFHVPLRSKTLFHALSYTWGSQETTRYLNYDGSYKISVTQNLYDALSQFRANMSATSSGPYLIWVDAICINQDDDVEKGLYIPRMHDIYEAAAIVLISIAPTDHLTPPVCKLLEGIAKDLIDTVEDEKPATEFCYIGRMGRPLQSVQAALLW